MTNDGEGAVSLMGEPFDEPVIIAGNENLLDGRALGRELHDRAKTGRPIHGAGFGTFVGSAKMDTNHRVTGKLPGDEIVDVGLGGVFNANG
jgi:hypothetical protein